MPIDFPRALTRVIAALVSACSPAWAQTAPPATLPEVTVTSTKENSLTQPGIDTARDRINPGLGRSVFAGIEWRM